MKRRAALLTITFSLIPIMLATSAPSFAQEFVRYTGKYVSDALPAIDLAILEVTFGEQTGNRRPVNGRIAFRTSDTGFCASGHFEGTVFQDVDGSIPGVDRGDYFLSVFTTSSLNEECESVPRNSLLINATFSSDLNIVDGTYILFDSNNLNNSGTFGGISTEIWEDLENLRNISEERAGTLDGVYARFWSCLHEGACNEYQTTGEDGLAGGFNKFVFDYMRNHPQQSALNFKCSEEDLVGRGPRIVHDFLVADALACFEAVGKVHFSNELRPAFTSYCNEITPDQHEDWDQEHIIFVEKFNLPCFSKAFDGNSLPIPIDGTIASALARSDTKKQADNLREEVQIECLATRSNPINNKIMDLIATPAEIPEHPLPPTKEELFVEELASLGTLTVTAEDTDLFFLPVGSVVQIRVTKQNPDGSTTELTASPEIQYAGTVSKDFASITLDGVLSILSSPHPFASNRPLLRLYVQHKDDIGVGQFAIFPNDADRDLLADSYEVRFGLDPTVANDVHSDVDGDGLSDRTELMINTQPTVPDTDGDGFTDKEEFDLGSDPRDPNRPTVQDQDGDGIPDNSDNCPATANSGQEDTDGDGIGDVCDTQ